jgi:histidine triad (HIT) family protein
MPLVMPESDHCSVCDYLEGAKPYTILDRDNLIATLVTYEQRGQGHVLVVPVRHRPTLFDLTGEEAAALMAGTIRAATAIAGAFDPGGIALWQNNGAPANQSVPHVHFHVAGTVLEGGTVWGPVPRLPIEETDCIGDRLRPYLRRS